MRMLKAGDRVLRLEYDITGQGLIVGREYAVFRAWCITGGKQDNATDWRVELEGFESSTRGGTFRPCWDAHRFNLIHYVQACPHGIHWSECQTHKDGSK